MCLTIWYTHVIIVKLNKFHRQQVAVCYLTAQKCPAEEKMYMIFCKDIYAFSRLFAAFLQLFAAYLRKGFFIFKKFTGGVNIYAKQKSFG